MVKEPDTFLRGCYSKSQSLQGWPKENKALLLTCLHFLENIFFSDKSTGLGVVLEITILGRLVLFSTVKSKKEEKQKKKEAIQKIPRNKIQSVSVFIFSLDLKQLDLTRSHLKKMNLHVDVLYDNFKCNTWKCSMKQISSYSRFKLSSTCNSPKAERFQGLTSVRKMKRHNLVCPG